MTVKKHGVSVDSPDRLLIDAGAVYLGFLSVDNPGTLLGATRGGNIFDLTRTIRRMEIDGARGPVKGFRRVEEVVATIKANMMELTAENLRLAIADAIYKSGTSTVGEWETVGTGNAAQKKFQLGFLIDDCETIWSEGTPTDVVESLDEVDFVAGVASAKFIVGDGAGANQVLGSIDRSLSVLSYETLKTYEFLGLRIRSSIALKAGQLQLVLDKDAECASPEAAIDLPAIPASDDAFTMVMVPADFSALTADIESVGIKQVPDLGAFTLNLDQVKAVHGYVETNSESIEVNDVAVVRGTDYTMDYDKGTIQFVSAVTNAHVVKASYKHRTISTDAVISGETAEANLAIIKDTAYLDSVAIVGTITKFDGTTAPIIVKITNALCDTAFSLSLAPKDEAVPELTFTAHYANTTLDTEPWQITYPS